MSQPFDDDTLLARWLSGELSGEERQALERHPDFPAFERIVTAADRLQLPAAELQAMWAALSPRLEVTPKHAPVPWRKVLWWALAVAAALALMAILLLPMLRPAALPQRVATAVGEQKTLRMPDGSTLRLNAMSEVEISTEHWSRKRYIRLWGEAFFDVQKNPAAPFTVQTDQGEVTVLGTRFNVQARDRHFAVACYSGAVRARLDAGQTQNLLGGQQCRADAGNWVSVDTLIDPQPAWLQGETRFDEAQLSEVFSALQRQYGVTVEYAGLENRVFSGAFVHNDLKLALRMICEPLSLAYEVRGTNVTVRAARN